MASMTMAQTMVEVTDEALAEAARHGDRAAFSALVARYRKVAFAYAYARLRHRDEAEDIAQEAFVRAYLALDRFRSSACWGAWMMRILRNLCSDALRRRRARQSEPVFDDRADIGPSPEMLALAAERRRELNVAVADLPEKYRVPLLMHYGSGRTCREIALALELPESTVIGRLAGALRLLRRRMGVEGKQ
jgi:RNA polymerase sigma-70 factor (ECF subfamily)